MKKLVLSFLLLTGYQLQAAESHALQAEQATAQTMTTFRGSRVTIVRQAIEGVNYFVIQFQGTHQEIVLSEYSVQQCQALNILFADGFDQLSISEAPEDTVYSFDCTPEGVQLLVDLLQDAPTIDSVEATLNNYNLDQLVDLFMAVTALGYKHPDDTADRIIEILQERIKEAFFTAFNNHEIINSGTLAKIQATLLRPILIEELQKRTWQVKHTLQGHTSRVNSAAFNRDGQSIVTGSWDSTAKVWNAQTGTCMGTLQGHTNSVFSAAFNRDGQSIVTGSSDRTAKVWDVATGSCTHTLQGHTHWVSSAAFSPDGQLIATGSFDNTAKVWNARTGVCVHTLHGHTASIASATFSPDGQSIVTGSGDKTAKVWNARTGVCVHTLHGHTDIVISAAFSPDDQLIVTASFDDTAKVWNARTGVCVDTLHGHTNSVISAAFSPDGQLIVTASTDGFIRIFDIQTGACLHILQGHTGTFASAAFSPDGQSIVTGSSDQTAKVWQNNFTKAGLTPQQVQRLSIQDALSVARTGKTVAKFKRNQSKKTQLKIGAGIVGVAATLAIVYKLWNWLK